MTDAAQADAPRVVVDIAPVASLVDQVLGDLGEPTLLIQPGASPHDAALSPSRAAALEGSDLVIWHGAALTPALAREIETLAPDAVTLELLTLAGTERLAARETALFADAAHTHAAHDGDGDGNSDPHGGDGHSDDERDAASIDPHAWLDPVNARHWLDEIAAMLARLDAGNAERYRANAADAQLGLDALIDGIGARLAPLAGRRYVVMHDGLQPFERRFALTPLAAATAADAQQPGPRRLQSVRDALASLRPACLLIDRAINPRRTLPLVDGLVDARVVTIDPLGVDVAAGPAHYATTLERLGDAIRSCLDD